MLYSRSRTIVPRENSMGNWRAKAVEFLPEFRDVIEVQSIPTDLWIELRYRLGRTYDQQPVDEDRIGRIYDYAAWCFKQPSTDDAKTDLSSAVQVAFIEDIPLDKRISDDLYRWMSAETFNECEPVFRYTLSDEGFRRFAADFRQKKMQFSGPARI